jgi:cytochrome oxidase Cu insertion factor (SCO1/SenC/PrrC family)
MLRHHVVKIAGAFAIACATLTVAAACSTDRRVDPPAPSWGQTTDVPVPSDVRNAELVESSGRQLTVGSLLGKIVVVSDAMTLCQGTCPLDTANIVAAARRVESAGLGRRVVFLTVTIDPTRDTADRLAAYRRLYAPPPGDWLALTGSAAALDRFWAELGVYRERAPEDESAGQDWLTGKPLTYDITHSDHVFFIDTHMHRRYTLDGPPHVAPGNPIPPALLAFLSAEGKRDLARPDAQAWTELQVVGVLSWLLDVRIS